MKTEDVKILLALEPKWTVSLNGLEFLPLASSEISITDANDSTGGSTIRFGPYTRKITSLQWLRPNIVRIQARARFRTQTDSITLYPGERLPSIADLRRRRR